jgi:hypothetical protein
MGDHTNETLELQKRRDDEIYARERYLEGKDLYLDENSTSWILNHTDCFVSQSRGNESVKHVLLCPHAFNTHNEDFWDKVGQAVGNLQSLERLQISRVRVEDYSDDDNEDEDLPIPDWEILGPILRHVRQSVKVDINDGRLRTMEEVQSFARAIRGHPTITSVQDRSMFPYESLDTMFSALATLPALESLLFGASKVRQADESTLANPGSLTELLRVPSLRFVQFNKFSFTRALLQALANALIEGTAITKLKFYVCSFPAEESATIIANGLGRNTSVISISVCECNNSRALFDALAGALPSNSALRHLELFRTCSESESVSPVISALGQNTGLKSLKADCYDSMDESLCTAMMYGLAMNETLESLEFINFPLLDDESAALGCRAFSFLRTNKTLKSLLVRVYATATESSRSTLRSGIVAMLQENASLESLEVPLSCRIETEEYIALVTALQLNTTLKSLKLGCKSIQLNNDESKRMKLLLKKNYALESLRDIDLEDPAVRDVSAILRLNAAGRRYLVEDGSSISKGVGVLSRVNNDINCVFLHLLENPRLCDRSAVEMTIAGENTSWSSSSNADGSGGGKREQASVHKGKDSRRRLV